MSSYLWDASFFTKLGFNLLQNRMDSQPLINTTVYNWLWNLSDPLIKVAHQMAPTMVPVENMGVLHQVSHLKSLYSSIYPLKEMNDYKLKFEL